MAYPHYQITVPFTATNGDQVFTVNAATGDKGRIHVGPMQYICRRVAMQPTTTVAWATGVGISFRLTTGQQTSATAGEFAKISHPASGANVKGGIYFNDSFTPKVVKAGYTICVANTQKATGKLFRAWAMLEPSYERLQNTVTSTGKGYVSVTG